MHFVTFCQMVGLALQEMESDGVAMINLKLKYKHQGKMPPLCATSVFLLLSVTHCQKELYLHILGCMVYLCAYKQIYMATRMAALNPSE